MISGQDGLQMSWRIMHDYSVYMATTIYIDLQQVCLVMFVLFLHVYCVCAVFICVDFRFDFFRFDFHFSYSPQRRCNLRKRRQRLLVVDGRWFVQLAMPNPLRRYQLCRFHPRTSKSARKNNFFYQTTISHPVAQFPSN